MSDRVETAVSKGKPILISLFILSLLAPIQMRAGPVLLLPYRTWLLLLFIPLFIKLISNQAGRMMIVDWMMLGSALWSALALSVNHPLSMIIEPAGVNLVEFFGAYLLGRVGIRSAADFRVMVKTLFMVLLILLPFAVVEAVTGSAVPLKYIPSHIEIVDPSPRFGLRRVQSVFAHPIHFGAFVSSCLGLVWFALNPASGLMKRVFLAILVGSATFLSLSTGALLAFIIQFGLICYELVMKANVKRWTLFAWGFSVLYVVLSMIAEKSLFHTLVHKATFSSQSGYTRILIFEHGMENVWANPIFGLGFNDWERPSFMSESVDNFWLLFTMRYGLPAFLLFVGALFLIMRRLVKTPMMNAADWSCRAGYLTSVSGIILAGGTVDYWKGVLSFVVFIIASGVWMISGGLSPAAPYKPPEDSEDVENAEERGA